MKTMIKLAAVFAAMLSVQAHAEKSYLELQ